MASKDKIIKCSGCGKLFTFSEYKKMNGKCKCGYIPQIYPKRKKMSFGKA